MAASSVLLSLVLRLSRDTPVGTVDSTCVKLLICQGPLQPGSDSLRSFFTDVLTQAGIGRSCVPWVQTREKWACEDRAFNGQEAAQACGYCLNLRTLHAFESADSSRDLGHLTGCDGVHNSLP